MSEITKEKLAELQVNPNPDVLNLNELLQYNPSELLKALDLSILTTLSLTFHQLRSLEPEVLASAVKLERVFLHANPESTLDQLISESLPRLDVTQGQKTTKAGTIGLSEDTFKGLPPFKCLYLDGTNIGQIAEKTFDGLGFLEELHLQNNCLESLDSSSFRQLKNVKLIRLDKNRLGSLEHDIFSGLFRLENVSILENEGLEGREHLILDLEENVKHVFYRKDSSKNDIGRIERKLEDKWSFLDVVQGKVDPAGLQPSQMKLYNKLRQLPMDQQSSISAQGSKELDLANMDLKWLQTNALTDLVNTHQIECLNLENNRLKELGHAALHNMPSLTKVDLQRNQLTRLPQDMFLGSQALQTIYLRHNQLQEIHADAFRACGALVLVEVSDNSLRTLATSTFRDMSKLETLNLAAALDAGCRLEAQLFHGLTALENLYLNGNKLASLEPELFCQLQSLVILDLSRNNLSRLEPGLFQSLINLKLINLDDNQLDELSASLFRGLGNLLFVSMDGNVLQVREFLVLDLEPSVIEFTYRKACGAAASRQLHESEVSLVNDLARVRSSDASEGSARFVSGSMTEIDV